MNSFHHDKLNRQILAPTAHPFTPPSAPRAWRASAAKPAGGGRRPVRDAAVRDRKPRNPDAPRAAAPLHAAARCEDTLDLFPSSPAQAQAEQAAPAHAVADRSAAAGHRAPRAHRQARKTRQSVAAISAIPPVGPRLQGESSLPAIIPFQFETRTVRVQVDDAGLPWFNATDVCDALEMGNPSQAIKSHVDAEDLQKLETLTAGGRQRQNHVNESGLYALILGSTKDAAKRFKRWVTGEVLPTIRKTGAYTTRAAQPAFAAPTQDRVASILLLGEALARVPGVNPGIAMAATLTCIHENTGLMIETLRRSLPASIEPICTLNATEVGKLLGLPAPAANQLLARCGLQFRNARDEWELSRAGESWGVAMPYSRNGHSGYQLLWNPRVAQLMNDAA